MARPVRQGLREVPATIECDHAARVAGINFPRLYDDISGLANGFFRFQCSDLRTR